MFKISVFKGFYGGLLRLRIRRFGVRVPLGTPSCPKYLTIKYERFKRKKAEKNSAFFVVCA